MKPLAPALALLALASSACGPARAGGSAAAAADEDALVSVRTAPVARGPISHPIRATGTLAAKDTWALSFRQGGRVAAVQVEAGDRVRRGQPLATLDAVDVAAQVRQAREARDKAARDAARVRALRAEDAVAAATAQDAETGLQVAEESLRAAAFAAARTTLTAPDDGFVDARLVEPGEVVGPGQPVLRVSGHGRGLVVRAAIPERDVIGLAPGRAATVTLPARPGAPIPARVTEVGRVAGRGTGTYDVEVSLDAAAAPGDLPSGLTARVEIAREVPAEGAVPLAAVQEADGERGVVYALDGDRARRVPVTIAFLSGDRAVLASGLGAVEAVVVEGAPRLADGARVRRVP
jgi:membrane fusion protein, multidrug efflux system